MSSHLIEQDELMAYLDGELEAGRAAEAALHLKQCPQCQKLAAELQEVSLMMVSWQVEEAEPASSDALTAAIGQPYRARYGGKLHISFLTSSGLIWAGTLAALILLAFAIAIPSRLRSRMAASEATAASQARTEAMERGLNGRDLDGLAALAGHGSKNATTQSNQVASTKSDGYLSLKDGRSPARPTATPGEGSAGKLARDQEVDQEGKGTTQVFPPNGPMIIRTADLDVVVKEIEKARSAMDGILERQHGHVSDLSLNNPTGAARSLTGTLRIPSTRLDSALAELRALGRVEKESQGGEEVTQQYVDLQARLANALHTEQRLTEILRQRTGKLSDVLAVEMQISRVRGEIEQMEAQRKTFKNQVDFATLNLTVTEDYKKELSVAPPSTGTKFRNAAVDGFESLTNTIIAVLLWLLSTGPALLLWGAILFFPMRIAWRRLKPRLDASK